MTKSDEVYRLLTTEISENNKGVPWALGFFLRVMNEYCPGTPRNVAKNRDLLIKNDVMGESEGSYFFLDPAFELWFRKSFLNEPFPGNLPRSS